VAGAADVDVTGALTWDARHSEGPNGPHCDAAVSLAACDARRMTATHEPSCVWRGRAAADDGLGRPRVQMAQMGAQVSLVGAFWSLPPFEVRTRGCPTLRGCAVHSAHTVRSAVRALRAHCLK